MSRHDRVTSDPLEDTGLSWEDVATTASIVYARLTDVEVDPGDGGWMSVARHAGAMFGQDESADEGDVEIPLPQLASQLRRAYARAIGGEGDIPEWADLAPKFRDAWEGVTRHMSNVFGMDSTEARRLGQHEDRMVAHMKHLVVRRLGQVDRSLGANG